LFDEIQDKSRQLAEASERKSQFLASMSHELRTPLNAIIGLTEMMVSNAARFGTEKALEPLRRVNAAGTHLLSLINEILDLSKIEAGKLELRVMRADETDAKGCCCTRAAAGRIRVDRLRRRSSAGRAATRWRCPALDLSVPDRRQAAPHVAWHHDGALRA